MTIAAVLNSFRMPILFKRPPPFGSTRRMGHPAWRSERITRVREASLVFGAVNEVNDIHRQCVWCARSLAVAPFQGSYVIVFRSPGRFPGLTCHCPFGANNDRTRTTIARNNSGEPRTHTGNSGEPRTGTRRRSFARRRCLPQWFQTRRPIAPRNETNWWVERPTLRRVPATRPGTSTGC